MLPKILTEQEMHTLLERLVMLERLDPPQEVRTRWYVESMDVVRSLIRMIRKQREDLDAGFMEGAYARLSELQYKERQLNDMMANQHTDQPATRISGLTATCRKCGDRCDVKVEHIVVTDDALALRQTIDRQDRTIAGLQNDLLRRDITIKRLEEHARHQDMLAGFHETKLKNAFTAVDTTMAVKAEQDKELTRLRDQVTHLQTAGTQQVEKIRELERLVQDLEGKTIGQDHNTVFWRVLDRRLAQLGVERRAQPHQDGTAPAPDREREIWQHAACLTIAEGTQGWDQPTERDSPAMKAVRDLRSRLNGVLEKLREAQDLATMRGQVIHDMTSKWAERRRSLREKTQALLRDKRALCETVARQSQELTELKEELSELKEWREVVVPVLDRYRVSQAVRPGASTDPSGAGAKWSAGC